MTTNPRTKLRNLIAEAIERSDSESYIEPDDVYLQNADAVLDDLEVDYELVLEALGFDTDPRHIIEFRDDGWTIAHPLEERLNLDTLFGCGVTWSDGDIGYRGRYYLWFDEDGEAVVGDPVD